MTISIKNTAPGRRKERVRPAICHNCKTLPAASLIMVAVAVLVTLGVLRTRSLPGASGSPQHRADAAPGALAGILAMNQSELGRPDAAPTNLPSPPGLSPSGGPGGGRCT